MTSLVKPTPADSLSCGDLLLLDGATVPLAVVARHRRPWDRLLTGWRALALDTQLATGCSADDSRWRAVRADRLVAPAQRQRLAASWEDMIARAHRARGFADPRVPLARAGVLAAESDILAMTAALRSPLPVPVRGVAMASVLLTDGSGPVYNRRSTVDLTNAVQRVTRQLDPFTALTAGG